MKGIFSGRSALFQSGILIYFCFSGLILSFVIGYFISTESHFYTLHILQFMSCVFIFLIPSFATAFLCSHNPKKFLRVKKVQNIKIFLLAGLMLLLIYPTIELTAYLNSKIQLPEYLSPVENWIRQSEDKAIEITESLLSEKGIIPFSVNLLVIAVMAGITEEFLFRGALLSIIRQKITNPHLVIWLVAVIFSAVHFQFYGFLPRTLLGAFLGYTLYWSKNIWVPVFLHILNNSMAIISYNISQNKLSITESIYNKNISAAIIFAVTGLGLFIFCFRKMKTFSSSQAEP